MATSSDRGPLIGDSATDNVNADVGRGSKSSCATPLVLHRTYAKLKEEYTQQNQTLVSVYKFFSENGPNIQIGKKNTIIYTDNGNEKSLLEKVEQALNQFSRRFAEERVAIEDLTKKVSEYCDRHSRMRPESWLINEHELTEQLVDCIIQFKTDKDIFSKGVQTLRTTRSDSEGNGFHIQKTGVKLMIKRLLQLFGQTGMKDLNNLLEVPMSDELKRACAGIDCHQELNRESCTILVREWALRSEGDADTLWEMVMDYVKKRTRDSEAQVESPASVSSREQTTTENPPKSLQPGIQEKIRMLEMACGKWDNTTKEGKN